MYFLVDNKKKIIFGWSAKCGCSHIKYIYYFLQNDNIETPRYKYFEDMIEVENDKLNENIQTIGNINEVHTGSYISFKVASEKEASSLLSYMKCRLPNFMLS